ncbi:ABC transporter permease [Facklamia sp. DSM 111018]|uniref:ABC transporter permease n=1 Tax=Facklamia lactis TaxID=2749967 RepID=A0ABS0LN14_9LACT|nr:ABC transporter permease [Facklamia lactis]MBG9979968.1 ABC transporter permease [Facklamia lactis]MBG9985352.1 ABC transporter permease [Facklamia lactis]
MDIYYSAVGQGILWGIMGLGLYISFRILGFADLTSESSFTLGGAVSVFAITSDVHPLLATLLAILAGMTAGWITGILTTYFEISGLLASIITMTGLYSVSLGIMQQPNLSLRGYETVFSTLIMGVSDKFIVQFGIGILFTSLSVLFLSIFFRTDIGQAVIATGDNAVMADSLGINTPRMMRFALMLANGLIGLSGALIAQDNGFADIQLGTGTVVIAFSSIVIGEAIFYRQIKLPYRFISIILGASLYRVLLVFVLKLGFDANYFRLLSALVLAAFLGAPAVFKKIKRFKGGFANG